MTHDFLPIEDHTTPARTWDGPIAMLILLIIVIVAVTTPAIVVIAYTAAF